MEPLSVDSLQRLIMEPVHNLIPQCLLSVAMGSMLMLAPGQASAQASPLSEAVVIGAWTFRPSVEIRIRGEYRRHPVDTGGNLYGSTAVLSEGYQSPLVTLIVTSPVEDQWFVAERSRLGVAVDHGAMTGVLVLQDARLWGTGVFQSFSPMSAPYEAYIDVHTRSGRRVYFRLGRQKVRWGDGRLVSDNDWSFTGRSLDAARFGFQVGDIDIETMAALLAAPGSPPALSSPALGGLESSGGTGAQLYGLDAVWHWLPLLNVELTTLARIVRQPSPAWLTPSDTYVLDGRLFGERRGFRYALEGAYELGRVATFGGYRDIQALALAGRAELETVLPGHLTFGVRGSYATGDDGSIGPSMTQKRFDPILPDEHANHGPMGLYAWSNLVELGGQVDVRFLEELTFSAGYTFVGLASAKGRWTTGRLLPVGSSDSNNSTVLGHEIDGTFALQPWDPLRFDLGYGMFAMGDGGKAILGEANRSAAMQHWVFLQTTLTAP